MGQGLQHDQVDHAVAAVFARAERPDGVLTVGTALAVCAEESDADGWLRLNVIFQDSRHAEWALWQHATHAEVLAPQELRTSLHNRAAMIATRYGASS